jgi:hypothetical protein
MNCLKVAVRPWGNLLLQQPQGRVCVRRQIERLIPILILNPQVPGDVRPAIANRDFAFSR